MTPSVTISGGIDLLAAWRARMLGVRLLSGGDAEDQVTRAGAFRVYRDAAEPQRSPDARVVP